MTFMADLVAFTGFRKAHLLRVPKARRSKTEGAIWEH